MYILFLSKLQNRQISEKDLSLIAAITNFFMQDFSTIPGNTSLVSP